MQLRPARILGAGPAQVATGINDSIRAIHKLIWIITAQHQQGWKLVRNFNGVPRNGFAISSLLTATRDAVDFFNKMDVHPNELLMPSAVTTALAGAMTSYDITNSFYFWWSVYAHHTYQRLHQSKSLRIIIRDTLLPDMEDRNNISVAGMRTVLDVVMKNSFDGSAGFFGEDGGPPFRLSLMTFYRNFFYEEREQNNLNKNIERWRMLLEAETVAARVRRRDPT